MFPNKITLRQAKKQDLEFLFEVSTFAMLPVSLILDKDKVVDPKIRFKEYKAQFEPNKIQIIVFEGKDIGRLRVVDREKEIYVGGIQILPEYQNLGVGTCVFNKLIDQVNKSQKSIVLEVHKVNTKAISFYKKLGFKVESESENKLVMRKDLDKKI